VVVVNRTVGVGERGRVPFALVGILLVVTSALYAAGIGREPRPPEPAVDLAMERTEADARTAVRQATSAAAVAASNDPVISPADTPYGNVIDEDSAFEDALRIRIYLATRERLRSVERTHRGVRGNVSLPRPTTPAELERAKERVEIGPGNGDGTELRVTVHNVTQTAKHGGEVVGRRNLTISVEVDSPVLAVHERVEEFQRRLDAGLTKPGLSQKVTARLYAVAWTRGYAQYAGAPISNVVSNRHVSLLTNGAVLGVQESVFGRSDPDARRAHHKAIGEEVLTEAIGRTPGPTTPVDKLLEEKVATAAAQSERRGVADLGSESDAPGPEDTTTVEVGETAVEAFVPFTCRPERTPGGPPTEVGRCTVDGVMVNLLNHTTQRVYSADVRAVAATERVSAADPTRPDPPDAPGDWELVGTGTRRSVTSVEPATETPNVSVPDGFHVLSEHERRVTIRHTLVAVWHDGENDTFPRVTYDNATETKRVRVAVVGRHAPARHAPNRSIETVHQSHPGAGKNLADVPEKAGERILDERGGPDGIATSAALGGINDETETVLGDPPPGFTEEVYPELVALRQKIREIEVTVPQGDVGTYEVNPPARLAAAVREKRAELVDAPETYESVADKARVELRAMYVDRVIATLEERAQARRDREDGFAGALAAAGGSLGLARDSMEARRVEGDRDDTGDLRLSVDGAPPYLTLAEVGHDRVAAVEEGETVYPLKAENINVFTIPYGDATDEVVDWVPMDLSGEPRTQLRTGARALDATESAAGVTDNRSVAAARANLTGEVSRGVRRVKAGLVDTLDRQGIAETPEQRREIVDRALARWDDPRSRAVAIADRRVVPAVLTEATAHEATDMDRIDRDLLRIRLRNTVTTTLASKQGTVSGPVVSAATDNVKRVVGNYTQRTVEAGVKKGFNRSLSAMPAGLPIAPVPGYWVVTANVWIVNVKGSYERFAVETPRRTPTAGDASLEHVRDGTNVTLDVDGDGGAELLGRSDRVEFEFQTAVVVVVPPNPRGVGDKDGNMVERSEGWKRVVVRDPRTEELANGPVRSRFTFADFVELASGNASIQFTRGGPRVVTNGTG
jgi:hypothetical protein